MNVVFIAVGAPRYIVVEFVVHYRKLCTCLACVRAVIPLSPVAKLCQVMIWCVGGNAFLENLNPLKPIMVVKVLGLFIDVGFSLVDILVISRREVAVAISLRPLV